jgi:adenine-specific DNA-methyltransferase
VITRTPPAAFLRKLTGPELGWAPAGGVRIASERKFISGRRGYVEGSQQAKEDRVRIFVGAEFGIVSRPDLVTAAREVGGANFEVLIECHAANYCMNHVS